MRKRRSLKAANLAIDRKGLIEMLSGTAVAASGMVPPNSPWFGKPNFVPIFDLEAARGLMREAGYGPNNRIKTKTMISNSGGGQMQPVPMNDFIQASFADIWIDVEFVVADFSTLFSAYRNGATAPTAQGIHAINVASPVQDPGTAFLRSYVRDMTGKGGNWGAYSNPAVEAVVNAARGSFDPAEFDAKLRQLHELVVDDATNLMVVHDTNPRALSLRTTGFVNPQNWFADFTSVSVT
jgi:peptide/nickel transport system substrate-binding protein